MYKYHCLNPISEYGLSRFTEQYEKENNIEQADAILVRSAAMHDMEFSDNLKVVARAGAGVNNIPLDRCAEEGIVVFDHKTSSGIDSHINLIGCTVTGGLDGLWVYGNGVASEEKTTINIEGSIIEGLNYAGILCNGSQYGVDITVSDSTVKGYARTVII